MKGIRPPQQLINVSNSDQLFFMGRTEAKATSRPSILRLETESTSLRWLQRIDCDWANTSWNANSSRARYRYQADHPAVGLAVAAVGALLGAAKFISCNHGWEFFG